MTDFTNNCSVMLDTLTKEDAYLVKVPGSDSGSDKYYYIGTKDTLNKLTDCPMTRRTGDYYVVRLATLKDEDLAKLLESDNTLIEDNDELCKIVPSLLLQWELRQFAKKPAYLPITSDEDLSAIAALINPSTLPDNSAMPNANQTVSVLAQALAQSLIQANLFVTSTEHLQQAIQTEFWRRISLPDMPANSSVDTAMAMPSISNISDRPSINNTSASQTSRSLSANQISTLANGARAIHTIFAQQPADLVVDRSTNSSNIRRTLTRPFSFYYPSMQSTTSGLGFDWAISSSRSGNNNGVSGIIPGIISGMSGSQIQRILVDSIEHLLLAEPDVHSANLPTDADSTVTYTSNVYDQPSTSDASSSQIRSDTPRANGLRR